VFLIPDGFEPPKPPFDGLGRLAIGRTLDRNHGHDPSPAFLEAETRSSALILPSLRQALQQCTGISRGLAIAPLAQ
jgi:hypothetical protein